MLSEQTVSKFRTFIENYYKRELFDNIKKGNTSILIDFAVLSRFDIELSEQLLSNFLETVSNFEESIKELDIPEATYPIKVRFINLPRSAFVRIRDIRGKHLSKVILTEGLIRQASDIRPKVTTATFECPGCGALIRMDQTGNKFREPGRCPNLSCGRKGRFRLKEQKLVDVQRLVVEETPEALEGGEQPKRVAIYLQEDLLEPKLEKRRYPGNKVRIVGIVKEVPVPLNSGGISATYDLCLEANSIETIEEDFEEISISQEDERAIKELASKPDIYEQLAQSIAPSIYGHENIKLAIILQLFSGVKKVRKDGTRTRGDMHIFLVGDPGAGKSQILTYVATLAPKARYVAGKGSTAAGITAAVVRDEFIKG